MKDRVLVIAMSTRAANAYLNLLDEQRLLQGPPVTSETETDIETDAETDTGTETGLCRLT